MKSHLIYILVLFFISLPGRAAILWGDGGPAAKTTSNRFNYDRTNEAREVGHFWEKRKMGVGLTAAGVYGLMGGTISVHWHPQWSVDLGYGGGSHFQSFGFRVKKMLFLSSPLNPYIGVGFQRWQREGTRPFNPADVSPGFVADRFMSDEDRATGRIDEKLIHASLGVQYTFTGGPWLGYGFFLEALFMMSAEDFANAPTASLGVNYFF